MKLHELQIYDPNANHDKTMLESINSATKRWNNKEISAGHYHSQLALYYSVMCRPVECKMHAALVPEEADAEEKAEAMVAVGRMFVFEKKIEEALQHYEKAYAWDSEHYVAMEEAGWCCFELKQFKQAEEWFAKAIVIENDWETFWEGLGLSLAQQEKYEEAITAFNKGLEVSQSPNQYLFQHRIGQCYAAMNDLYRAIDYYTKCLDANPTYATALNDMAAVYFNEDGDMANAIAYLKKAEASADQTNNKFILQTVYINLSRLYDKLKEFELHELYKAKLLSLLGFGDLFGSGDDEYDEENEEYDEDNEDKDNESEDDDETGDDTNAA